MVETHIAHAINGRFQVLNGIPRQLTVGNLRQELMEVVIKFKKIIQLLALNGNALLVKILFQLVALAFGNHARRPTRHRALNGLTDKTAVSHLGHGNFVDVAATLWTNLNQAVFRQFNKGFTNRLA